MPKQNKVKVMVLKRTVNWFSPSGAGTKNVSEDEGGIIQSNQLISAGELFDNMELTYEA